MEQKNGHLVRQVEGYDRFVGAQAYQHLDDLYRILSMSTTIEEAIGDYLAAQQQAKRRPKTMEWHQTASRAIWAEYTGER